MTAKARLQRTQKGRDEIQQKTHILEQNERMVLVLVDGITTTEKLQRKLRGVANRRFALAIADLTAKGFLEKAAPDKQSVEQLDAATIERFVRQDPMDPVPVAALRLQPESSRRAVKLSREVGSASYKTVEMPASPVLEVDFYLPLEVQLDDDSMESRNNRLDLLADAADFALAEEEYSPSRIRREWRSRRVQVGYWLLFAGVVGVIVLLVAQRSH